MIARFIARIAHAIVSEYRELDSEPERERRPFGFYVPTKDAEIRYQAANGR